MKGLKMNMRPGKALRIVLITGGSGYIGSIVAHELIHLGYRIVVLDKRPLPFALQNNNNISFFQGDYADPDVWQKIMANWSCEVLIHLAACIEVGESFTDPARYYDNNVVKFIRMLDLMRQAHIPSIIAASSSAVYGDPRTIPMSEQHQRMPLSPYGRTKMMLEDILYDYHNAYEINIVILRFANVAGGLSGCLLGECHDPETHLIPRLISSVYSEQKFLLHGNDYPTADGTCVRDFVHVHDVARLHSMLLDMLYEQQITKPVVLNVGSGKGNSVRSVIAAVEATMQKMIILEEKPRRPGDAPSIVLDISAAYRLVRWQPLASDLTPIIVSACQFHALSN
jgi:UDP-glucose 4-epimerase